MNHTLPFQGKRTLTYSGLQHDFCKIHLSLLLYLHLSHITLCLPGGFGVRREVKNEKLLQWLRDTYNNPDKPLKHLLSVCTGSWLLAKAGLLNGKRATSNKLSWQGALAVSDKPQWVKHARWVEDGNIITASGKLTCTEFSSSQMQTSLFKILQQSCKFASVLACKAHGSASQAKANSAISR